jgi:hypothetical protein
MFNQAQDKLQEKIFYKDQQERIAFNERITKSLK